VTYIYAKRPVFMQRKTEFKETYIYEQRRTHHAHRSRRSWYAKRPTQMERDLYMKEKRMQRDLCIHKETYVHAKETYVYAKETYVYAKEMRTSRTSLTDKLWTKNRER